MEKQNLKRYYETVLVGEMEERFGQELGRVREELEVERARCEGLVQEVKGNRAREQRMVTMIREMKLLL